MQVLNLVFQAPVNHLELLALLLPVFGGALLVGGTSENGIYGHSRCYVSDTNLTLPKT
ncbi:hypothetical protein [Enterobacter hormaechei]|uniref:hypothetical protein n=1 Tax=Enterobacter hormaechei TaxID=158836 RepID=UPI00178C8412|nr:hypothetical protein [Enterobacter hormaechei]